MHVFVSFSASAQNDQFLFVEEKHLKIAEIGDSTHPPAGAGPAAPRAPAAPAVQVEAGTVKVGADGGACACASHAPPCHM